MRGRGSRRAVVLAATLFACAALPQLAAGHTFQGWTGGKGPFRWETKRLSCGEVGGSPSRVGAHTRWRTSPANGYVRVTFTRQLLDEGTGEWVTVHRQRRSTKNTPLEGSRAVLHWTQWFNPFADEGGTTSRHLILVEWHRDRAGPGPDRRLLRRERTFAPCVVAAG